MNSDLKSIIIDDEHLAIEVIEEYSKRIRSVQIQQTFTNAIDAIEFLQSNKIDLVFLDINMPDLDGLQFLNSLQLREKPMIIFTTAYSEYAIDGFHHNAIDYLLKPIEFEKFISAVNKAHNHHNLLHQKVTEGNTKKHSLDDILLIKDGGKTFPIKFSEILFIQGSGNYVTYHTEQKKIMSLQNLNDLETLLPESLFMRVHRSYIIAKDQISFVEKHQITIKKTSIPLGKTYRKKVHERFNL